MIRAAWRAFYRKQIQPRHDRGLFAPLCFDCRLLRKARAGWIDEADRDYWHDEPLWMVLEAFKRAELTDPVEVVPTRGTYTTAGRGQNWAWDAENGARRIS